MTNDTIPTLQWLSNQIEKRDTELLRPMLKVIAEFPMGPYTPTAVLTWRWH